VEFKTLEYVHVDDASGQSPENAKRNQFLRKKRADSLSEHVRQMAVSQTVLRETHAGCFLVMVGRDHRVLVLEDEGRRDRLGLPTAFVWLKNSWNYWFAPNQLHAEFLKQFAAVVAPYSRACALRKQLWDSDNEADMSDWQCLFEMIAPHHARLLEMKKLADAEVDRRRSSSSPPSHLCHAGAGIVPRPVDVAAACAVAAHDATTRIPVSRTTPRDCCDTHCDWMVYEAASKPSPGQCELPSTLVKSGSTFSTANPKSDVEVKIAAAAKTPGPGQYFHGGGASQGRVNSNMGGRCKSALDMQLDVARSTPGPGSYDIASSSSSFSCKERKTMISSCSKSNVSLRYLASAYHCSCCNCSHVSGSCAIVSRYSEMSYTPR
jgi:hypothetical protein